MKVDIGLVLFNNTNQANIRLKRDIFPTINYYLGKGWEFNLICIDNNSCKQQEVDNLIFQTAFDKYDSCYWWNNGHNPQLAHATNQLVDRCKSNIFVYVCASHGKMLNPTWLEDIIKPLENPQIAMAGDKIGHPGFFGGLPGGPLPLKEGIEEVHIQGGVYAASVEALREYPFGNVYPHIFMDVYQAWNLQYNGNFKLAHVPTIKSIVGPYKIDEEEIRRNGYRYLHGWQEN